MSVKYNFLYVNVGYFTTGAGIKKAMEAPIDPVEEVSSKQLLLAELIFLTDIFSLNMSCDFFETDVGNIIFAKASYGDAQNVFHVVFELLRFHWDRNIHLRE